MDKRHARSSSTILFIFWLLLEIVGIITFRSQIRHVSMSLLILPYDDRANTVRSHSRCKMIRSSCELPTKGAFGASCVVWEIRGAPEWLTYSHLKKIVCMLSIFVFASKKSSSVVNTVFGGLKKFRCSFRVFAPKNQDLFLLKKPKFAADYFAVWWPPPTPGLGGDVRSCFGKLMN